MQVASQDGLVFNREKCEVKKDSVTFFGTVYNANGAHPDPKKVDAIHKIPSTRESITTTTIPKNGYISLTIHPSHSLLTLHHYGNC